MKRLLFLGSLTLTIWVAPAQAQTETPTPTPTPRVWSVEEILAEPRLANPTSPIDYCQGGRFAPCVCWQDVARDVRYRPAVKECNGNAAIILSGRYKGLFSVVVRDTENRDRWPAGTSFGGCSAYERDTLGLAKCSAFKVQEKFSIGSGRKSARVHCLGAAGYSKLFKRVVRITAKLADVPNSNKDPLIRWCIRKSTQPLN